MDGKKEVILTSVEQVNDYIRKNADEKTLVSIVFEFDRRTELVGGNGCV